jgi:cytochrome c556
MKALKFTVLMACAGLLIGCGQDQGGGADKGKAAGTAVSEAGGETAAIITARQDKLKKMGAANRAMADELKKSTPDVAVFKTNADLIAGFAPDLINWFPAGTGMESGVKTAAKAEVWSQPDQFKAAHERFVAESAKFQTTVATGDLAAIGAGVEELGLTCRNCHQVNRQRD